MFYAGTAGGADPSAGVSDGAADTVAAQLSLPAPENSIVNTNIRTQQITNGNILDIHHLFFIAIV